MTTIDHPYEATTSDQPGAALVEEFLSIHAMFRDQLQVMLQHIDQLQSGAEQLTAAQTRDQIQALIRTGAEYTQLLHAHHNRETLFVFPVLQADGLEQAVVDRLNVEHDEISTLIDTFYASVQNFATIEPAVLNHDLRRLSDALRDHLTYEETHVCPLFARWSEWPPMD